MASPLGELFGGASPNDEVGGTSPLGSIFNGDPTMDRTASSNWRSDYTTPAYAEQAHDANLTPTTPNYVTKGPGGDMSNASGAPIDLSGLNGLLTGGFNLAKGAGQKFQDFQTMLSGGYEKPLDQPQDFGSIGSRVSNALGLGGAVKALGTAGNIVQAPLGLPSLLSGDPNAQHAALGAYKTEGGDTPGIFDVPAVGRALSAGREAQAGALGQIAGDTSQGLGARALAGGAQFALGALPNVAPLPFLPGRGGARVAERPAEPLALAPRRQLALPEPQARPAPEVIPARAAVVDTTARPAAPSFEEQIAASVQRQKANPTPITALADRAPISTRDTGGGRLAVPLDAEQIAAQRGEVTPAQQAHADNLGIQVADRNAANLSNARDTAIRNRVAELAGQPAESAAATSLSQQLADSLRAKGRPDLIVGETKPKSDYVASNPRLSTIHDANEAVIAAARSGDLAAAEKAMQAVKDAGGSLDHTRTRLAQAGVSMPTAGELSATKRGGQGGVSTQRAGGTGGLGGFLRQETGSTSVRNALGLGLGDLLRGAVGRAGGAADGGGYKAMTAAEIAAAKSRLAERMGVNAETGAAPGGFPRSARPTAPGGPPPGRRIGVGDLMRKAENVTGVGKTLTTAASPFHFMFRHALPAMVAHPQAWAKGSVTGLREGFTMKPRELTARQDAMRNDPVIKQYGTYIGKPHGGIVSGEESVPSTFLNRVPILGKVIERSGQGFVQGLNEVRYMMTKGIDAANPGMTAAQKASMGETVNTFTGRGIDTANMGDAGKAAMRAANVAMFSPQMLAARLKMLAYTGKGMADVLNNVRQGKTPDPVALERARLGIGAMTGMGLLYGIGQALGGKTDTNPVSTTFGQTDMGPPSARNGLASLLATELGMGASTYAGKNTMLNPTESESTQLRTMARMAVAIYDAATQQKNLQKMEGAKTESTPGDIANHWVWSLFSSPLAYPIAQFLEYGGKYPTEPLGPVTPMVVGSTLTGAGVEMPTVGGKPSAAPKASGGLAPFSSARPDLQVPGAGYAQPTQPPPVKTARPAPTRKPTATVKR